MKFRILSLLLSVLLLLSFCGCEGKGKKGPTEDPGVDCVWHADYIPFPDSVTVSGKMTVFGDRVLMTGSRSGGSQENGTVLLQFSPDTGTFSDDPLPTPEGIPADSVPLCALQSSDGTGIYVHRFTGSRSVYDDFLLTAVEKNGKTRFSVDVRTLFDASASGGNFTVDGMCAGADGTLYVFSRNTVAALSSADGCFFWQYAVNGMISGYGTLPDGRAYLTVAGPNGVETHFLSGEKKGLGEIMPTAEAFPVLRGGKLLFGGGYDFYYAAEDGLFAANLTDAEPTTVCSWLNSDINYYAMDTDSITVVSPELILCIVRDPMTNRRVLCRITPVAPEDVVPKQIIRVGKTFDNSRYLISCVLAFNQRSDTYRVVVDDYSGIGTELMQTAEDRLAAAIMAGRQPDLLICDSAFDYETFERQGLFCDLYPFLEAPASPLKRDDLLPCVSAAMESAQGELRLLPESFHVHTVCAKTDDVGGKASWTVEEFLDAAEAAPEGTFFSPGRAQDALTELLRFSLDTFIDRETLTASFDSALFGRLLAFCKTVPDADVTEGNMEAAHNGELMICPVSEHKTNGVTEYLQYRYYGFQGAPVTLIGYPTASGSGSVMQPETVLGITAASTAADGAWEFICLYMTGDGIAGSEFLTAVGQTGYPVTKTGLETLFKRERNAYYAMQAHSYSSTGANGRTEEEIRAALNGKGVYAHLTEEDEACITAMLDGITSAVHRWDETMLSMIAEDASPYFSGAKSLEETQKIIEGRMSVYISETLG